MGSTVKNLDSPHKFLLYPRFIQLILNKQQRLLLPHTRTYPTPILTSKLFGNMRRASKGYSGVVTPLFENMLVQAQDEEQQQSPSRITSSPSLSPQPTPPSPSPDLIQPTYEAEETASMPHDSPLHAVHLYGSAEGSKEKGKIVLSDDEEITEDSSKQRRKISQIDEDPTVSLVQDEEETPTEIIEEHGSGEKGKMDISTANIQVSIASPPKVSTTGPHMYTRRSANDKGNAIMEEPATPKKVKKRTQVQLSMDEELARKMEEEERIRFNAEHEARALQEEEERLNLKVAKELQRQLDQRQDVPIQPTQTQGIDWNDPSVLGGYKESYFKKMSYYDIKPIFERVWDHVNTFISIRSEVEKDSSKPSEKETSKIVEEEKVEEEDVNLELVLIEKKAVGIRRKTLARRGESDKLVPDEEAIVDPKVLHTKFPIVDWESQSLGNMHVYKIIRADGNTSYHKTFESMLKSFDRHDLEVLHRLVMERFQDNTPEGYNLMLWGDLKILVDPEQDDDIWKNQNSGK
ncbi:hypothetical protein Tco_1301472 [Tanacetum coccineum]